MKYGIKWTLVLFGGFLVFLGGVGLLSDSTLNGNEVLINIGGFFVLVVGVCLFFMAATWDIKST